ncbi:MAG: adenylate/guanylate cyclase domain-containing protein [Acidimicrobiaceae bacterium]|nr:adenylate/guanylate cyclase domain-containing protein [Acidimicrobiaceae bacterium]MBT6446787.1 adenylate/guanylate cyclase domain-containing protein [Acidimicrobiaceae bacterium]
MSELTAAGLRARGIDHERAQDDNDLLDSVRVLLSRGVTLDELEEFGFAKALSQRSIRPNPLHGIDADEALDHVGIDEEFSRRLRLAMGLQGGSGLGLTPEELEATRLFASLADLVGEQEMLSVVRVVGSSTARIARATTELLRVNFQPPIDTTPARLTDAVEAYAALIDASLPAFLDATAALVRRHLAAVLADEQAWMVDASRSATLQEHAIGFADLVGFTAFTEQVDAAAFMAAMVQFEREVQDAVVDHGGTVVKLIGDEVMFATPDPVSAVRVAAALVGIGRDIPGLDGMRVGLAYGQVIRSGGDFYGTVVNTAARIVGQAYPDAIVATQRVVDALRAHEHASEPPGQVCETQPLGPHDLRGIQQPVELYRLRP